MMTMVGGDREGSRKGARQKSSKVIFDDFGGDLDDPGVEGNFFFLLLLDEPFSSYLTLPYWPS